MDIESRRLATLLLVVALLSIIFTLAGAGAFVNFANWG